MSDTQRWRRNLQGEVDGVAIYRAMAAAEHEPAVKAIYERLAVAESRHARVWARKLRSASAWRGLPRPSWRAKVLILIARRLGPDVVERSLARREVQERIDYEGQDEAALRLTIDERSHARMLGRIARAKLAGPGVARLSNALRAAVLGVNDGLVSNISLVMGVAGAGGDNRAIVVAGAAGLLAGSLSMALGEWLSVQSSRELYERQLVIEHDKIEDEPATEIEEIALIYMSKGMDGDTARNVAGRLVSGSLGSAQEREQGGGEALGDMGGSAAVAAATSFAMFAGGAVIPLLPFLFANGGTAQLAAAVLTGAVLFLIGSFITTITGQPALRSGLRQLAVGAIAAMITYGAGVFLASVLS